MWRFSRVSTAAQLRVVGNNILFVLCVTYYNGLSITRELSIYQSHKIIIVRILFYCKANDPFPTIDTVIKIRNTVCEKFSAFVQFVLNFPREISVVRVVHQSFSSRAIIKNRLCLHFSLKYFLTFSSYLSLSLIHTHILFLSLQYKLFPNFCTPNIYRTFSNWNSKSRGIIYYFGEFADDSNRQSSTCPTTTSSSSSGGPGSYNRK